MNTNEDVKKDLLDDINYLLLLTKDMPQINQEIEYILKSLNENFYKILVLGEFKRGKSTFVNAIIGNSILPMNVLPETATVNAVIYSSTPRLQVIYRNGTIVNGELTSEYLQQFSANNINNKANEVEYIKIGYPVELLRNRVVLIDTPGVEDLNDTRCEITYGLLPTADAILFILDGSSPLTSTEKLFLDKIIKETGVKDIIFIINKIDQIDDEEDSSYLSKIEKRIKKAFTNEEGICSLRDITIVPLSARYALQGFQTNNIELIEESGFHEIISVIKTKIINSSIEKRKIELYRRKLSIIARKILKSIKVDISMRATSLDDLKNVIDTLDIILKNKSAQEYKIAEYTNRNRDFIINMTKKSLQHFSKNLREDILDCLNEYNGVDIRDFVERKLSKRIQKNIESWINSYLPCINKLINDTEIELAKGISRNFNKNIRLSGNKVGELNNIDIGLCVIHSPDISNSTLQAGAITALGTIGLMSIVGSIVMPLMAFGGAYLREYLVKSKVNKAKLSMSVELDTHITKALIKLEEELLNYIDKQIKNITSNAQYTYGMLIEEFNKKINEEIACKQNNKRDIQSSIRELESSYQNLYNKIIGWRE